MGRLVHSPKEPEAEEGEDQHIHVGQRSDCSNNAQMPMATDSPLLNAAADGQQTKQESHLQKHHHTGIPIDLVHGEELKVGAGDQGNMLEHASDDTEDCIPLTVTETATTISTGSVACHDLGVGIHDDQIRPGPMMFDIGEDEISDYQDEFCGTRNADTELEAHAYEYQFGEGTDRKKNEQPQGKQRAAQAPATGRASWGFLVDSEHEQDKPEADRTCTAKFVVKPAAHRKARGAKQRIHCRAMKLHLAANS